MNQTMKARIYGATLVLALLVPAAKSGETNARAFPTCKVSLQSLLDEMVDRDAAAKWPAPAYVCKEASSHDRRKTDPSNAETWHSNNDHEQFIRAEVNEGRQEWVIMEDSGPGAITRFWTPLNEDLNHAIVRFYLDGLPTPAISAGFNDLFRGCGFVPPPFAFVSWNETNLNNQIQAPRKDACGVGGDLYLPIPFAKGCKITLDKVPFYHVVNYRIYEPGTDARTFSMADYQAAGATLNRVGNLLLAEPETTFHGPVQQSTVAPGGELTLKLPRGSAAVRAIQVRIEPQDTPHVLRWTILQAAFDGETTVWCPLSEFFGAGVRLNRVQDWQRMAQNDGTLTARWVMPYQHTARLVLRNYGTNPVSLKLAAATGSWKWDGRSLHFHANWHCQQEIKTRPYSDWNYIEIQGRGVYAGDTLTVFSPVSAWYGEGDERIYIDGEKLPSHIGTGTEDYYGYAWGMSGYFSSPFISAPKRDGDNGKSNWDASLTWAGYTTTSRLRLLDGIPFRTRLRHDMEIWDWADTRVDYAVGTFWYARPGAAHNRPPQPEAAACAVRKSPPPDPK